MNNATDLAQVIPQAADYVRILPEIVLAIFGMIVMVLDPLMDERRSQQTLGALALVGRHGEGSGLSRSARYGDGDERLRPVRRVHTECDLEPQT